MNPISGEATKFEQRTYSTSDRLKLYDCLAVALWRSIRGSEIPILISVGRANVWSAKCIDKHLDEMFGTKTREVV